ncbi:MAG: molybdopterin-dependent oxidoreductase [Lachnospiraceae bacterium]|nr:molybdopterin-dependent oxidoreductase [Lachnospiraceae bacterium]
MAATAAVGAMSMFGCSAPADETTAGTTPAETIPETTPEAPSKPVIEEQVYCGVCRGNCASGCLLNVHVRDGKVVRTSMREMPDERYNRICMKGLTQPYRMYNADRLKYPMRRVGERGEGKWEQITWDEAIKEITDKWKGYQAEYGTQSVAVYKGSGNFATINGVGMGSAYDRFKNVFGVTTIGMDVDAANVTGVGPVIGRGIMASGNEAADLLNAKTIIVWGANPVNSQQQTTHFLLEAKENGTNLIVIDPILSGTASKADIYVPIRPGSDAAMAMAMMEIMKMVFLRRKG